MLYNEVLGLYPQFKIYEPKTAFGQEKKKKKSVKNYICKLEKKKWIFFLLYLQGKTCKNLYWKFTLLCFSQHDFLAMIFQLHNVVIFTKVIQLLAYAIYLFCFPFNSLNNSV